MELATRNTKLSGADDAMLFMVGSALCTWVEALEPKYLDGSLYFGVGGVLEDGMCHGQRQRLLLRLSADSVSGCRMRWTNEDRYLVVGIFCLEHDREHRGIVWESKRLQN